MARVQNPAIVKDDSQNLLTGVAKELNRRIYGEGVFRGEPSSPTLRNSPSRSVRRFPGG
jgi:hypothetical protein